MASNSGDASGFDEYGFALNSAAYDEAIMNQMSEIRQEIAAEQDLVGPVEESIVLLKEYEDDIFLKKIKHLSSQFPSFRRTRGDGNCFFRAFGFALLEALIANKQAGGSELERVTAVVEGSLAKLVAIGYPEMTSEDFYEVFLEQFKAVADGADVNAVFATMNEDMTANYIITYLRMLTSGHMKMNEDDFAPFIEGGLSVQEFCNTEVDPMGVESGHLQIKALADCLGVGVQVAYLDRTEGNEVVVHTIPDGVPPLVHLLYRPGHYDVIYN